MTADSKQPASSISQAAIRPEVHPVGKSGITLPLERIAEELRDRYTFEREIGRGGGAFVYLARDIRNDRLVAVKILRPELSVAVGEARFQREIEVARQLDHPNILPVFDAGSAAGLLYFTMPYVEGGTLRDRVRRERQLPLGSALSIAREVARALDHAHERGVVHRDVKPANILLANGTAVVADFGIARAMTVTPGSEITDSGVAIGTPEYMSPEQGTGQRELDARTDIYSLGCVLYEMIAGEPPFTGPTAQAIVARHCLESPRSIRVIRPSLPVGVERAIKRALEKVPADRFETATEFIDEAESAWSSRFEFLSRISSRNRVMIAGGLLVVGAFALWQATARRDPAPDPNRIVVFPLHDPTAVASTVGGGGEDVATFIGYALDRTRPLKWLDGWELLEPSDRSRAARLEPGDARRLGRGAGAGFYIDGSIIRRPDSVTVVLRLYDLAGDSLLRLAGRSGPTATASLPQLGLEAVGALLPVLLAPGGKIDLSALSERRATVVANFLQGEREYRRMQFRSALAHYELAVGDDSTFMLPALRGAQAAYWLSEAGTDVRLSEIALRQVNVLPPAQALLARGLHAYLTGAADSAVLYLRLALRNDPSVHAAWTLLGEVYSRLLPVESPADSLARDALEHARRADSDFAPTLLLLEEMALRDGNVTKALTLRDELRRAGADTTHRASRDLMLRCVRDGPQSIDWQQTARGDSLVVLATAKILSGRASQPRCSIAAFESLLSTNTRPASVRWAALLGLLGQLAATDDVDRARSVFASEGAAGLPLPLAHLLLASGGLGFEREARKAADSEASSYGRASTQRLWIVGSFEARLGNLARLRAIARTLAGKADSSRLRRDLLLSRAINARLTLLEGDSAGSVVVLRALVPSGTRREIEWEPWESLGPERLLLAELLYARGSFEEARRVATQLDATEPVTYPLYLRPSLELRVRIAQSMNKPRMVSHYSRRLQQLSGN